MRPKCMARGVFAIPNICLTFFAWIRSTEARFSRDRFRRTISAVGGCSTAATPADGPGGGRGAGAGDRSGSGLFNSAASARPSSHRPARACAAGPWEFDGAGLRCFHSAHQRFSEDQAAHESGRSAGAHRAAASGVGAVDEPVLRHAAGHRAGVGDSVGGEKGDRTGVHHAGAQRGRSAGVAKTSGSHQSAQATGDSRPDASVGAVGVHRAAAVGRRSGRYSADGAQVGAARSSSARAGNRSSAVDAAASACGCHGRTDRIESGSAKSFRRAAAAHSIPPVFP